MAFKLRDRVWETSTTTGTGTLTLSGAASGYLTFASMFSDGDQVYYFAVNQGAPTTEWEVGIGTYSAGTMARSASLVLDGASGPGTLVNFGAGTKDVFCGQPARATPFDSILAYQTLI